MGSFYFTNQLKYASIAAVAPVHPQSQRARDALVRSGLIYQKRIEIMSETGMRVYELGFIIAPNTPEAEVPAFIESLKDTITKVGGSIVAEGNTEFIDLAYTMEKHIGSKKVKYSQGYFGWVKFQAAPESLEVLKKAFDSMTDLVRYLIVKTSLENTVLFKKPKVEARRDSAIFEGLEEEAQAEAVIEGDIDDIAVHEKLPDLTEDVLDEAPVVEEEEKESE